MTSSHILDQIYSHSCLHGRCWELWWSPTTRPITILIWLQMVVDSLEPPVEEHEVRRLLQAVKPRKVVGPDCFSGRVLRNCAEQLARVFTKIFNLSVFQDSVPIIVPLTPPPKKTTANCLYDRPVVLTLVLKCFERLVWIISCPSSLPDLIWFDIPHDTFEPPAPVENTSGDCKNCPGDHWLFFTLSGQTAKLSPSQEIP